MKIPLHEPIFDSKDFLEISKCFKSGWLSSGGRYVVKLEKKISKIHNVKYCSCVVNGSAALQVSLRCIGIEHGDEVLVPTVTFISTINSIIYNNASPVFFDVGNDFNIDQNNVLNFFKNETFFFNNLTYNKKTKKIIKAIIIVHVFGNPANFEKIYYECKKRNIKIIEDAAENLGTKYVSGKFKNRFAGTIGDLGCYSFNGNKIISSGGGGAIVNNNKKYKKKIDYLITQAKNDGINYIHDEVGFNFKMSNLHASIGCSQIKNLNKNILRKKKIHEYYLSKFKKNKNIYMLATNKNTKSNYWLNIIFFDEEKNKIKTLKKLLKNKIEARSVWYPNHLQKPFKKYQNYNITKALSLVKRSICLPSSPHISKEELNKVIKIIND